MSQCTHCDVKLNHLSEGKYCVWANKVCEGSERMEEVPDYVKTVEDELREIILEYHRNKLVEEKD